MNSLCSPESKDSEKYTAKEIWQMIADKKSIEEMGFDSEDDFEEENDATERTYVTLDLSNAKTTDAKSADDKSFSIPEPEETTEEFFDDEDLEAEDLEDELAPDSEV